MVNYLRTTRTWWRSTLSFLGAGVIFGILGLLCFWLYSVSGNSPWVWLIFAGFIVNYAIGELGDRLDAILWTRQDIRERLPEPPRDYDHLP